VSPITVESGGSSAYRHNYYDPDDFFSRNHETGEIRRRDGQRVVAITEDFIASLLAGTAQEVGEEAARAILYQTGVRWALVDMKNFQFNIEKEFGGTPVSEMHLNFVMETWWWPLTTMGWGGWKYDFSLRKQGIVTVDLYDSVVAKSLERLGRPVCYWYAGLFAGLMTHLSRRELNCIEIQCYASGHDVCRFMIGSDKRINPAAFWVEEGASAAEVLEKLVV
jgi:predicted hydrocarbon binding protein